MKKTIFALMIAFLLLISLVEAVPLPMPLTGIVSHGGDPWGGVEVKVYINDEFIQSRMTSSTGRYLVDLGGLLRGDDVISVHIQDQSKELVVSKYDVMEGKPQLIDFSFFKEIEVIEKEIIVEVEKIVCSNGDVVDDINDCPEEDVWDWIWKIAVGLLGGLGFGAGFLGIAKYHWNKGNRSRALKMLFTASKRAKEGRYDKHKK